MASDYFRDVVFVPTSSDGGTTTGFQSGDVGAVGIQGSTSASNGTLTVAGSGADIWGTVDAFQLASQALAGDGQIVARVVTVGNTDPWAKAGVMIRETRDPGSRHAMVVVTTGNGVAFQRRTTTSGASTHTAGAAAKAPYWVKLVRQGSTFIALQSQDGQSWSVIGSDTVSMASSALVGLAVTSHNNSLLNTATLDTSPSRPRRAAPAAPVVGWNGRRRWNRRLGSHRGTTGATGAGATYYVTSPGRTHDGSGSLTRGQ